jgi:transposase
MIKRLDVTAEPFVGAKADPGFELSDERWALIADLFPTPSVGTRGGRPSVESRSCFEGILWVLRSGARWKDLPENFPSPATCRRRHKAWTEAGVLEKAWRRLLRKLDRQGRINREESFADGTFSSAKKGVNVLARPNAEKAPRLWCSPTETVCRWG